MFILRAAITYMVIGAASTIAVAKLYEGKNNEKIEKGLKKVLKSDEKAMRWLRDMI